MVKNLKLVCLVLDLSLADFVMSVTAWHTQGCQQVELTPQPSFCSVSLNLSMHL
jgi:hypothetical protein